MSWISLTGRMAVVTGAGSGIGERVAGSLSKLGATVLCADANSVAAEDVASMDPCLHPFRCDVTSEEDVRRLFLRADELSEQADSKVRAATILVNCAGITKDNFVGNMSSSDWDSVIDVNLKGSWLTCKEFSNRSPHFLELKPHSASIVNVASLVGKIGNLGQSNYAASKAGVLGLTRSLSKELARSNVRVNAVLPGFITTPMSDAVPDKVKEKLIPQIAMRRFGHPQEVADLITFLSSSRASYVSGAEIEIDGRTSM